MCRSACRKHPGAGQRPICRIPGSKICARSHPLSGFGLVTSSSDTGVCFSGGESLRHRTSPAHETVLHFILLSIQLTNLGLVPPVQNRPIWPPFESKLICVLPAYPSSGDALSPVREKNRRNRPTAYTFAFCDRKRLLGDSKSVANRCERRGDTLEQLEKSHRSESP
ncbi:hypothetical protein BO70DRAFT_199974 [Aspergillus heteromorphus CBS 117.55]|uniref:Uncharacterized protein n=1 Tax=Aspergillus heteromorphus CBS 117.55 TaxID=1448321 RepID=A0A317WQZ4_9EURO|nr:uncharacterized protein BO70DRAFT_199974 [Aspergillus heteromorphus CBS 117.55]PWY87692.1 hypothetical protein BO70DRAFT_199974 [Aspergillus heteromorphus CBS 117.55]